VADAAALGGAGQRPGLGELAFGRKVLPVIGHAECRIGSGKRPRETLFIVEIGRDHFDALIGQRPGIFRIRMTGDRPSRDSALRIVENGARQPAALRPRSADDRNDFAHRFGLPQKKTIRLSTAKYLQALMLLFMVETRGRRQA